jgi:glycosyltransferase involved in cell wall biosynthesis
MVTVCVLAFNEEALLGQTVTTIIEAAAEAGGIPLDIIIVNDGSTDRTPQIIRQLEAQYPFVRSIHHERNRGPGVGAKKAIELAKFPKFISVPGDNDLSKELLVQLFSNRDKAELILAYYLNMHERGWFRSSLSGIYTSIYRAVFGIPIQYINSPCLYPSEKLRQIEIRSDRFGYSAEMTVKMLRLGCSFVEVAGLRRKDDPGSSALSLQNLNEVSGVFLNLVAEVYLRRRRQFRHKPVQIKPAVT